jgi:uncharacterized protein YuzE
MIDIAGIQFDQHTYDAKGDVLYLHVGTPQAAAETDATPEGHAVRFNAAGEIIGITLVNARWLLDRDGKLDITLPQHIEVAAQTISPALVAA